MKLEPGRPEPPARLLQEPPEAHAARPPSGLRLWLLAVRPKTLSISVAPVAAGTALAWAEAGVFDPRPFLASLAGALLIQAGTNLYNDVGDALRGGDQPLRQGPPRVTALGWASPEWVKRAALVCFAAAALVGLYLSWLGGPAILALGAASLAAGWAYSNGPRPIAYTPLGEVFVIAFFGLGAVGGTYWLQAHALSAACVTVGLSLGLVAAAVLLANNYRDMEPDRLVGRRTLAIRLGVERSKLLYGLLLPAAAALPALPVGTAKGWLALCALPMAVWLILRFAGRPRGPEFNMILADTARFQLMLALLIAVGVLLP